MTDRRGSSATGGTAGADQPGSVRNVALVGHSGSGKTTLVEALLTSTGATPTALQAPGDIGVLVYVSGSWSGTAPAVMIDNVAVIAPSG